MANLIEIAQWETGIYRIETTDPVIGGEDGISNAQAKLLGNRTLYLKGVADDHETRVDSLETSSSNLHRMLGSGAFVKHGVATAAINNGVFNFASVVKNNPPSVPNEVNVVANATSPLVLTFSNGYDANGPVVYYGISASNSQILIGNNLPGILYAEYDPSLNSVSINVDQNTTRVVASYSDPGTTGYWYSLKDEKMYRWNGTAWINVIRVILGSFSFSGSGSFSHYATMGKGVKDVYGRGTVPAGTVSAFAGATSPAGYLLCDGGAISRNIYSDLYAAIGTAYGVGDGSTTFNLPDLRGEFIRGLDNGRGIDNDSFTFQATTTNGSANVTNADTTGLVAGMSITGTGIPANTTILSVTNTTTFVLSANATATGNFVSLTVSLARSLGSFQNDQFQLHTHKYARLSNAVNSGSPTTAAISDWEGVGNVQSTDNPQPVGGSETRPRNIAMNYIIKF